MSKNSISDEERRQVRLAFDTSEVKPYLTALIRDSDGGTSVSERADCQIIDAKYRPGQSCSLLYRVDGHIVLGVLRWDGDRTAAPGAEVVEPLGMALTLFPHDPALPGLESALRPEVMATALENVLPECREEGLRIAQCKITPVRYRPNRRCTLRIELRLRDTRSGALSTRTLYGKVYHDEAKATSVYAEMQMLADATSRRPGGVAVAAPAGFLPELLVVLQRPVSGTPLIEFLGRPVDANSNHDPRGRAGVEQAARALAELQELGVASERERPPDAELRKMASRARGIGLVDPGLGARMEQLVDELSGQLESLVAPGAEKGIVQGDCKPDQFLIQGPTTTLLDFDHCGMADPATDVATFVATFRQLRIKHSMKSPRHRAALEQSGWLEGLDSTFLDRYCAVHGDEGEFRLRATWYEAQALLRKAQRGFARSIRSPLPAALVDEAWRCLSALPSRGAMAR